MSQSAELESPSPMPPLERQPPQWRHHRAKILGVAAAAAVGLWATSEIGGCDINLGGVLPHTDATGAVDNAVLGEVRLDDKIETLDGEGQASGTFFEYTSTWIPFVSSLSERHVNITRRADVQIMLAGNAVKLRTYDVRAAGNKQGKLGVEAIVNIGGLSTQLAGAHYGHYGDGKLQVGSGEAVGARFSDLLTGGGSTTLLAAVGSEAADNTYQRLCGKALEASIPASIVGPINEELKTAAEVWQKTPGQKDAAATLYQLARLPMRIVLNYKGNAISADKISSLDHSFLPPPTTKVTIARELGMAHPQKDENRVNFTVPHECDSAPLAVSQQTQLMIESSAAVKG